jgi:hypothetical protein
MLVLHNVIRWVVLVAGVAAAVRALYGWLANQRWQPVDNRLGMLFTISLDIQILVGLILYFVLSPITTGAFSDFGGAMSNAGVRFFLVEHLLLMIIAVALAHIGRSMSRKAASDEGKHKRAAIFFTIAVLLIIAGIPWADRPLLRLQ